MVFNGNADEMIVYKNKLYFSSVDDLNGRELWRYDPVSDSAEMVEDMRPGDEGLGPHDFTIYNDQLYFSGDDGDGGSSAYNAEMWRFNNAPIDKVFADGFED